jgi:hypothetical protein
VEVASEKNSTLIFPIPIELLSFAKGLSGDGETISLKKTADKEEEGTKIQVKKPEHA